MLRAATIALATGLCMASGHSQASFHGACDAPVEHSVRDKDRLLQFGAVIRRTLEQSGHTVAIVARSGMNLTRFGIRYSHSGISLRANPNTTWSIRQLYYSCEERKPRIFDQGLAAFVLGFDDPAHTFVSVVLLPQPASHAVEQAALDTRQALALLNPDYSANSYAFSERFQNCNQWVIELLASAWGRLTGSGSIRHQAQAWLHDNGYRPSRIEVQFPPIALLSSLVPWLRFEDHPAEMLQRSTLEVSMPASIERYIFESIPGAQRIEFCSAPGHVVIRRGWAPIEPGCRPGAGDEVVALD